MSSISTTWSPDGNTKASETTSASLNNATLSGTLTVSGATQLNSTLTVGADADGTDRTVTFGHSTLKTIMGIDDSADAFVINTDASFDGTLANNSLSIDASHNIITAGNVTMAGDLTVSGGDATLTAANDTASSILMQADNSDDAGDDWKLIANANQKFTIANDIASAGTYVDLLTITPHATASSSSVLAAGSVIAAGGIFATGSSYLSSANGQIRHSTTLSLTLDGSTKATFSGYVVEGRTVIKIPATSFMANDDQINGYQFAILEDDGSNFGTRVGGAGAELFAYVDVPLGYTATRVKITGSDTANEVEVYTLDLDNGTIGSEISNSGLTVNDITDLDSNHVGADDKMLLIKVATTATDDIVYGGYVTIEAT
jgi:hypothetical protein